MNIVIRTDASRTIGSGHVMRCLTLADELSRRGAEVSFVCRENPGHLVGLIEGKGYKVGTLPHAGAEYIPAAEDVAHAAWLGSSWQQDAADTIAALAGTQPDWLIVDHYALDRRWEETLRPSVGRIMVIDDLADRFHDADLLLDQNLYQDMERRYDDLVSPACQKLLGPKYALLRPEFGDVRKRLRRRTGEVERVLVFFGGVDPTNETEKVLTALAGGSSNGFKVDVVVGGGNLYKEQIEKFCAADPRFLYYCQTDKMAELMAAADLAIGAGGSATWERCAVGIPSIVIALADNQKELAKTGGQKGLLFYLGESGSVSADRIKSAVKLLLSFPDLIRLYSDNGLATVDARGAERVALLLCPPPITIRRASIDDCDSMYHWRNAEETRRYIFNSEPISLETHRDWFRRTLQNPDRILLIGEIGNKPVGVLRYDLSGKEALISVYLVPGGQGKGIGSQLIRSGSAWLRQNCPQVNVVNAEIFPENIASLRAFEAAGYREHHMIFQEVL